ncbi:MAG: trigger factor, partial [Alphaproteobacteria bacterium]|nr:trigger factor [Alphaproteobacteria bacterium]
MTMQITQTKNEDLTREFTVTMTADEIDQRVNERLTELGKTVKMPGFRPGKIPMNLLKSKSGKSVMGEVLEHAVNDSTMKAINENNLRPAMRPKIEVKTFDEAKGLEYTMAIEVLPEIKLADFTKIKLEKLTAKPAKKEITEALERI